MTTKICLRCGKEYVSTGTYQKYCPECKDAATADYMRRYYASHRGKCNANSLKWFLGHRGVRAKWVAENIDKVRATKAAYDHRHPLERQLITVRHRSKLKGNTPADEVLTAEQWRQVLDRYGHRCAYCGKKSDHLTVDHVVPISQGGANTVANVVPACSHCNSVKQGRTPEQWVGMRVCNG